jgi:peptide deformylase
MLQEEHGMTRARLSVGFTRATDARRLVPRRWRNSMSDVAIPEELEDLRIRVYPDKVLRVCAREIAREHFGDKLGRLASAMVRLMYDSAGVGLAAPQVGVSLRIIVIDPSPERTTPRILVNPRVIDSSGRDTDEEGCLSLPEVMAKVNRAERLRVQFETLAGKTDALDAAGLPARVILHEIDHLDGRLFVDRLGPEARLAVRDALRKLEEAAALGE